MQETIGHPRRGNGPPCLWPASWPDASSSFASSLTHIVCRSRRSRCPCLSQTSQSPAAAALTLRRGPPMWAYADLARPIVDFASLLMEGILIVKGAVVSTAHTMFPDSVIQGQHVLASCQGALLSTPTRPGTFIFMPPHHMELYRRPKG